MAVLPWFSGLFRSHANARAVILRWPPTGPARSGGPMTSSAALEGWGQGANQNRPADFGCRRPSRLAPLAPQDDGLQVEQSSSRGACRRPSYGEALSREREAGVRSETGGGARLVRCSGPLRKGVARMKPTGPAQSGGPDDRLREIRGHRRRLRSFSRTSLRSVRATKERTNENVGGETPTDAIGILPWLSAIQIDDDACGGAQRRETDGVRRSLERQ